MTTTAPKVFESERICIHNLRNGSEVQAVKIAVEGVLKDAFGVEVTMSGLDSIEELAGYMREHHPESSIEWINQYDRIENPDCAIGYYRITTP